MPTTSIRASGSRGIPGAIRSGPSAAASGHFTQQHAIFTIVKGGVGGRNGLVTLSLNSTDPLFPTFPNSLPGFPPGAVLPARSIQEISPDLENEHAWTSSIGVQHQLGARTQRGGGLQHQPRRQARVPRHERAGADPEGSAQRGARARIRVPSSAPRRRPI